MIDYITTVISILALVVSGVTAWFTLWRRGTVKITKPSFIAFCYEQIAGKPSQPKIFLRALLYSTSLRGHVIENMFLTLQRDQQRYFFNVWGYADNEKMSRGSGLFIGETGVVANHHFNSIVMLPPQFFESGDYELNVFVALVGKKKPLKAISIHLTVPENIHQEGLSPNSAIWFDWDPNIEGYHAHLETRGNDKQEVFTRYGFPIMFSLENT